MPFFPNKVVMFLSLCSAIVIITTLGIIIYLFGTIHISVLLFRTRSLCADLPWQTHSVGGRPLRSIINNNGNNDINNFSSRRAVINGERHSLSLRGFQARVLWQDKSVVGLTALVIFLKKNGQLTTLLTIIQPVSLQMKQKSQGFAS